MPRRPMLRGRLEPVAAMSRTQKYLPILLLALMVQIFAPVAACWSVAVAAADPLQSASICHSVPDGSSGQDDQGDGKATHALCTICCVAQASSTLDTPPQIALSIPARQVTSVVWTPATSDYSPGRSGSNAQARAPPKSI